MTMQQIHPETEVVEGIGREEDSSWGDYPLDTPMIRNENRTVRDVLHRIGQERFVMEPDFQRDFIWDEGKQSKFIESVLMRIPLPVFYLAEDKEGRMVVVDGLQRLSTFKRYVDGRMKLRLKDRPELNGKSFAELSPRLQNRIEDCNLTLYIIDANVPERARLDIFDRVNSGVALTRQQMRNSLYMGQATKFLKEEARKKTFLDATGKSLRSSTMRDREFINRFCAFHLLTVDKYHGEMDDFLAETLINMNALEQGDLSELSRQFQTGLENNRIVFGEHAFRKHKAGQEGRSVINASLWDVMTTGLSRIESNVAAERSDNLRAAFYKLMQDGDFMAAITIGTNDTRKVQYRFKATHNMFQEVFGARTT